MTSPLSIRLHHRWSVGLIAAAMLLVTLPASAQQSFPSPDEAAAALAAAAKSGATNDILKVLGRKAADIVESGDMVADNDTRERFVAAYDAKHSISMEGNKKAVLMLGKDDFPFPIPLYQRKAGWEFDTAEGRIEILYRRIGRNELDAIQTSLAFVDAEDEYADKDRGAGPGVYAQRIVSSPGKKDGLYWPPDGDESPLGELAAEASAEGYKVGSGEPQPYHGYYYRILTRQGPNAPGGELDYVVNGKMIGGFALAAYPAEYGNSGVMTFVVNHKGTVYQKDLGELTEQIAKRMKWFDPDQTWKKVEPPNP
ncbi:DUF2950 domain-containing protein [Bradyrhizobium sp. NP1]|uniref:DUF2950 domain-containing protein n=1 Tax=Bradyrhizobium sp. NP1 TaxID=3049772 RepID=UPI0025A5D16D|nr:DUF2950 domain-containing protein [Bradyrhizobium sp. NP1]WJR79781.1 DUF2950 domain-containing protein [Bradyrhizobium sp. NP1]